MSFVGRIIRIKKYIVPARLISTFYYNKRHVGRPNNSVRNSFVSDFKSIIPAVNNQGFFSTWAYIARHEIIRNQLVNNVENDKFEFDYNQQKNLILRYQNRVFLMNHIPRHRKVLLKHLYCLCKPL